MKNFNYSMKKEDYVLNAHEQMNSVFKKLYLQVSTQIKTVSR